MSIDSALVCGRRGLRTRPGTHLLGSTGARLWVDFLEDVPGFVGAIDFIHKTNIPLLFTVTNSTGTTAQPSTVEWRPSRLSVTQTWGRLRLHEDRFITWDDCAVSLQTWTNDSDTPVTLRQTSAGGRQHAGRTLRIAVRTSDPRLNDGLVVAPGQRAELSIVAAVGLDESLVDLTARADRHLHDTVDSHASSYQAWYDEAPRLTTSDPLLDRTWAYRWFLLRHNLARPGVGQLDGTTVYEGRSHKMTKTPWQPRGWEFSKLIPLSSPMHLLEARWYGDASLGAEILTSAAATQGEDGQLYSRTIDATYHHYNNFLGWAAAEFALVHGIESVQAALPALKRQVRSEWELRMPARDGLPVQDDHKRTGKEYQPSYWYFHDFPDDPRAADTFTPLKRVDQAIYQHLNAAGVARLCALMGDPDEAEFAAAATETADAVLTKQWDPHTGFFYDLHHETDAKALVRNVVGLYPWWAGITSTEHLAGFETAFAPDLFGTGCPLPSVAADCPVFAPSGGWKGQFLKGRNGCMWDGPTWPYTNSVALDAVGRMSQRHGHRFDELFADLLRKYCLLHFHQQDGRTPYLVEHYDSITGEPLSDEPDYFHSYLVDLIIRYVVGLRVHTDHIAVDPIDIGLEHFDLDDVVVQGRRVRVSYRKGDVLSLSVDGAVVARADELSPLTWSW